DGIRDFHVTGVQTCALPIFCAHLGQLARDATPLSLQFREGRVQSRSFPVHLSEFSTDMGGRFSHCSGAFDVIRHGLHTEGAQTEIGRASSREGGGTSRARGW